MSSTPAPDFGSRAAAYDELRPVDDNWWQVYALAERLGDLRGRRVLDVGCRTGRLSVALAGAGRREGLGDRRVARDAPARQGEGAAHRGVQAGARRVAAVQGPVVRACGALAHGPPRGSRLGLHEAQRVLTSGGRVVLVTFDESHFAEYWMNRYLPSMEAIDRARFPTSAALVRELEAAGFTDVETTRLDQHATVTRDEALHRMRAGHISTFDLLDDGRASRRARRRGARAARASRVRAALAPRDRHGMNSSIRLGRIAGIEIGVNWTWLAVVALIVWSLATSVFPSAGPGFADATYYAMAIVAALLFFSSLLLHELGHALEARREGMHIDGITLWLFGGVAKFRGIFPSAWAELRIALAGPLVSLVLGAAFIGAALAYSGAREADTVLAWLGEINIVLLVFNLLPALPLDGGRVLRSVLWGVRGDFLSATRVAAAIGRAFGALFVAGGLALVFFENATNGVWLALLGWFLFAAATSEAQTGAVQAALGRMRVRDVMVRQPTSVSPNQTIGELMDRLIWTDRHALPRRRGRPSSRSPAVRAIAQVPRGEWDVRTVRDSMTALGDVAALSEDEPLDEALAKLGDGARARSSSTATASSACSRPPTSRARSSVAGARQV